MLNGKFLAVNLSHLSSPVRQDDVGADGVEDVDRFRLPGLPRPADKKRIMAESHRLLKKSSKRGKC